jgi:CYTH domain-containing protein/predicted ATPase
MKNKNRITKIVITGGPSAGKSTALSRIEQKLSEKGYKVLTVHETATALICSGIFIGENCLASHEFHASTLELQICKERIYEEAARKMSFDNIIILYDRGTLDVKAYCGEEVYSEILAALSLNEIALRDSYDAVFHLKTAAAGAEEYYTLENNEARSESPEKAKEIDSKIINAWTGHPHLRIIDTSLDFENKISRLMAGIFSFLGLPVSLEIEREYLIKMPDIAQLTSLFRAEKTDILQTYLNTYDKYEEKRIRQRGRHKAYSYFLTQKRTISPLTKISTEKRISEDEYLSLLSEADTSLNQIRKERYCFLYNNLYFELDVYPFWKDYAILEIELTTENQEISFPSLITVVKEVTNDPAYKDYSLSKRIPEII